MGFLEVPVALGLAVLAVYVLAIFLRVACHFCGVEIPAIGRAYFSAAATAGLSLLAAFFIQSFFVGLARRHYAVLQVLSLLVILAANLGISTLLYALLLDVPFGRALRVWLVQAATFLALAIAFACCAGILNSI